MYFNYVLVSSSQVSTDLDLSSAFSRFQIIFLPPDFRSPLTIYFINSFLETDIFPPVSIKLRMSLKKTNLRSFGIPRNPIHMGCYANLLNTSEFKKVYEINYIKINKSLKRA